MPHPHRFYDDEGAGPAIILLHGYPFNRSMWREQINFLRAHDFRAIAPDLIEMSDKLQLVADSIEHETLRQRQAEAYRTIRTVDVWPSPVVTQLKQGVNESLTFDLMAMSR